MFESKLSGLVEGKQNQLKKAAEFVINGFLIILLEILREKKKKDMLCLCSMRNTKCI